MKPAGELRSYLPELQQTFRAIKPIAKRLVLRRIGRNQRLRELVRFTLDGQTTSEYPFVFEYAFCRRERDGARVRTLGAAIHLLQSSGFITDDIFDKGRLRYGLPAVHVQYDIDHAIIAAELQQSVALETIADELNRGRFANQAQAWSLFNRISTDLYLGQYLDIHTCCNPKTTERDYYQIISLYVGNFLAYLARSGALLADKPAAEVERLGRFAHGYGMALMITDDVIDVLQTPKQTGKSFASDLKGRKMRLPLILALRGRGHEAKWLRRFLTGKSPGPSEVRTAARMIRESGALHECLRTAKRYLTRAVKNLSGVRNGVTVDSFAWLASTLLEAQGLEEI
jgi:geranylgeranyl pyrophosphate synthase